MSQNSTKYAYGSRLILKFDFKTIILRIENSLNN